MQCAALTQLHLPGTLRKIGTMAFWGCDQLTELYIPPSVNEMGRLVFGPPNRSRLLLWVNPAPTPPPGRHGAAAAINSVKYKHAPCNNEEVIIMRQLLGTSCRIGSLTVKNRIVMEAMGNA